VTVTDPPPPAVNGARATPTTWPGQLTGPGNAGTVQATLDIYLGQLGAAAGRNIGFPAATDLDYSPLAPFLGYMLNNLGDPAQDGAYPIHAKRFERDVVDAMADLLRAPTGDRWGYVTGGATEGTEYALHLARTLYPDAIVYYSRAAHHSVTGVVQRLGLDSVVLRTHDHGEVIYADLAHQVGLRRDRPAVVVANAGTALDEAVDDTRVITVTLDGLAIGRRWIHVDAALAGIPLALLGPDDRPGFDLADGADSIVASGHKWLGIPLPCGVVLTRASRHAALARAATYTGSPDSTISNSRSGLAVLAWWWAWHSLGIDGHRARAEAARSVAAHAYQRLIDAGIDARRLPRAVTVTIPTPPAVVTARWPLAAHGKRSHLVCVPGVTTGHVDAFITDLVAALHTDHPEQATPQPIVPPTLPRRRTLTVRRRRT